MNLKRFFLTALAVFVTISVLDFVIHNVILSNDYASIMEVWRPNMMDYMWVTYISTVLLSLFFVFLFAKGYDGKGIGEGFRFGLIFGIGYGVVSALNQFMVYPIPFDLAMKWIVFGLVELIIAGIVASLIYKPK